ncbi:sugar ABC transporter permease, partial [Streptococcus pneumoniae]
MILCGSVAPTVLVNKIRMREKVISYAFLATVLFFFVIFV